MEFEIKVSVICNVYCHEKYIRDALDGFVMQQTNFPFEVLVHDDASTDKSAQIIREYEEKYPELIKPIYQTENKYSQGIGINQMYQIPRVKGKYVAFCEGDDYWTDPLKLQKQYDFMEAHPDYSLCACSTCWLNMVSGKPIDQGKVEQDTDFELEDFIVAGKGRVFQFATIFMRAKDWINRPEWIFRFPVGDIPLAIYARLCGKVHMLADEMAVYRWHAPGSWTVRMDQDEHRAKVCRRMIEGFTALNEQTNFVHNDLVQERIRHQKYTLALMEHDRKALRSAELRPIYRSRGLLHRLSDTMRCTFPKLYAKIRRMVRKVNR